MILRKGKPCLERTTPRRVGKSCLERHDPVRKGKPCRGRTTPRRVGKGCRKCHEHARKDKSAYVRVRKGEPRRVSVVLARRQQTLRQLPTTTMSERLKDDYTLKISPKLMDQNPYRNVYEVPKLIKIVINQGLGEALQNTKVLDHGHRELAVITGQKAVTTRSKRAVASWKLRAGVPVGLTVVLRGSRMYAFLDRLIHLALPRIRDFQGIDPKSFDRHGNYSFGLEEQLMFPEIVYDKVDQIRGMNITLVTNARTDREALNLLRAFGLPYRHQA